MKLLRALPTVKLAAIARLIRAELERRAEYAARFGCAAPGQISKGSLITMPMPHGPLLPLAVAAAMAVMAWLVLR